MRYLRLLTNAIAGGVLVATYLVVLVLQLNPHVPIVSTTALRWFVALLSMYGPYLSVTLYVLLLLREALAWRSLQPAWFSVRLLAWLGAAGAAAAAVITWANLRGFRAVLSDAAAERMREGAVATTVFAVVLLTIAVLRYSFGRRGSRATGVLLTASLVLSVGVPLWLRGPGEPPVPAARRQAPTRIVPVPPRVRLLAIDGASLELVRQRVAAGQLPNFGRLLDRGATIDLATLKPTQADPVWAAAATGKYPPKNGIPSEALYHVRPDDPDRITLLPDYCFAYALRYQGFIGLERLTADALRARTLWAILADYDIASGIVNWPLTRPAQAPIGYVISDHIDEAASSPLRLADPGAGDPTTAVDVAREAFDAWQDRPWQDVLPPLTPDEQEPVGVVRARWDHAYADAAAMLDEQFGRVLRLTAMRYEGVDAFGHLYLRDAEPERFGDLRRGAARRSVLDRYYAFLDAEIGRAVDRLGPGDLLLVVSGFGIEPASLFKRALGRMLGDPPVIPIDTRPGTHEQAPDGFLLAYGDHVADGELRRGSIVDVTPTVLYYMGLPIGRDMDGFARTDLFRSGFTREHPVLYTATHER
jgi:hypothetical protein